MKFLISTILLILLTSCGPSNYSDVRQMGYNYTALVESEDRIGQNVGAYGASYNSQWEATSNAMQACSTAYSDVFWFIKNQDMCMFLKKRWIK